MGEIKVEENLSMNEKREILGYAPVNEESDNQMTSLEVQNLINAYGIGVRSGAITAQKSDEQFFRNISGFPETSKEVNDVWENEGVRRPITLKSTEERQAELGNVQNPNQ
jgi:hypothetical protein